MEMTQEAILSLLTTEGGKVKNCDILGKFKGFLSCADPAEKKLNRELFKRFINNVAVVKEIDQVKYVVLKKKYHYLLGGNHNAQQHHTVRSEDAGPSDHVQTPDTSGVTEGKCRGNIEPRAAAQFQFLLADSLQSSNLGDLKLKRAMTFGIVHSSNTREDNALGDAAYVSKAHTTTQHNKPYALPLRMPPSTTRIEIHKLKGGFDNPAKKPEPDLYVYGSFGNRRAPLVECVSAGSPRLGRSAKTTKAPEEHKETKFTSLVPLEPSEHQWLVTSAAGHWSQVYGLLLKDNQLAEKRDFMSGFTALHWAAKCGNSKMLAKIIEISTKGGVDIDINAKTHGGYTPLHIAALHGQEFVLGMLVDEYRADVNIRDNCGKKAYHYLHKGTSARVKELLGEPQVQQVLESAPQEKEELDLFPDLSKGLHTISRLFQPHATGYKKKHKQRPGFYSLGEEAREETEENGSRHKVVSDVFT
ncbi:ankyrin repeat domain-containing protein SOWAHA-like [Lampris incognitus]|uniref:ankyrin repeat domain-containing protein SOWAHA-like n=1 Tax=Lampris incognitus TaxID=2546036 RepID=UPI0024B49AF1|nr:ankyrin repeat domain-containing protein SOWAHA-like [Lampris incognitus]